MSDDTALTRMLQRFYERYPDDEDPASYCMVDPQRTNSMLFYVAHTIEPGRPPLPDHLLGWVYEESKNEARFSQSVSGAPGRESPYTRFRYTAVPALHHEAPLLLKFLIFYCRIFAA